MSYDTESPADQAAMKQFFGMIGRRGTDMSLRIIPAIQGMAKHCKGLNNEELIALREEIGFCIEAALQLPG